MQLPVVLLNLAHSQLNFSGTRGHDVTSNAASSHLQSDLCGASGTKKTYNEEILGLGLMTSLNREREQSSLLL